MIQPGIKIIGLGPGEAFLITRQAWQILENATEIYLRTNQHPAVKGLPGHLRVNSFDHLYETSENFESVYNGIIEKILELGHRPEGVVYAVPGHPFMAEATVPGIIERASKEGLPVEVVEGLSFLEPTFTALGIDPLPQITLIDALELGGSHFPSFPPDTPAIIVQIHSRAIASEVKLTLMEVYPDEHAVQLIHGAGTTDQLVETLPLYEIDRSPQVGLLTSLYVPPLGIGTSLEVFQDVIAALRAPDGCPWDREQTHLSLRPHLLEEVYEVLTALDRQDAPALCEELGDLLLQIALHAQIASEEGEFKMVDILQGIHHKIVRRHPHVFGDLKLTNSESVIQNWERLKATEKKSNGNTQSGLLEGVSITMPALSQAQTYQVRAARVGFDWPEIQGVYDKFAEEIKELQAAGDNLTQEQEIGDLLFALVNLARWLKVDAESALRESNARFRGRFAHIEKVAKEQDRQLSDLSLEEMEHHWQSAKGLE